MALSFLTDRLLPGRAGFGKGQALLLAAGVVVALSASLSAEWNRRLVLAAGATAVSLILAEAVMRAFFSARYATIYEPHPRYLHRLIPGSRKSFRHLPANGGQTIAVEINGQGFRGAELDAPGQAHRIVVYGDSVIEAEFSAVERTFTAVLGRRLAAGLGAPVQAVNAGVVAYGPDQVSLRMEDELPGLAPRLAIVAVFAHNDFGDLFRNKIFLVDGGELRARNPVLGDHPRALFRYARYAPLLHKASTRFRDSAAELEDTPDELLEKLLRRSAREYEEAVRPGPAVTHDLFGDYYDADLSLQPGLPSSRYKAQLMDAVLRHMKAIAGRTEVPLLLVIVPSAFDVCHGYDYGSGRLLDWSRYPEYRPSSKTDLLAEIAELSAIPAVDLYPAYRKQDANRLYFHGGDTHWNDAGQDLAAALVTERVLSLGLLR